MPTNNSWNSQNLTADGQLLIGSTSAARALSGNLTAGAGVTITNGSGSITVAAIPWGDVTSSFSQLTSNNGYFTSFSTTTVLAMPISPALGSVIAVNNKSGGFILVPQSGQSINFLGTIVTSPTTLQTTQ